VLDKLGAVDGRDEKFGFCPGRQVPLCTRASETLLENRPIDLAKFRGGGGVLDADNNRSG